MDTISNHIYLYPLSLTIIKPIIMKKVLTICTVAVLAFGFTSCKKCGHCVNSNGVAEPEVCDGNVAQDAVYASAKSSCTTLGGTWNED